MERQCKICNKTRDLFKLKLPVEDDPENDDYFVFVCGSCWEIIFAIAKLAISAMKG